MKFPRDLDSSIFGALRSHHLTSGGELPPRVSPSTRTISKKLFGFRRFVGLWITLVFACLGLQVEAAPVPLPLEVIGAQGTEVTATLALSAGQASASQRLWLQTHNLRYAEKGSVRINGGAWVALNNTNATMLGTSQTYGGIGGSFAESIDWPIEID